MRCYFCNIKLVTCYGTRNSEEKYEIALESRIDICYKCENKFGHNSKCYKCNNKNKLSYNSKTKRFIISSVIDKNIILCNNCKIID